MAILGNIRKRTTVLILIIGLALFAFVISGKFTANDSGVKIGSSVAEVNGEDLSIDVFRQKVEQASRRYGSNLSSTQLVNTCLLYTSPSPRDRTRSRMPSSA